MYLRNSFEFNWSILLIDTSIWCLFNVRHTSCMQIVFVNILVVHVHHMFHLLIIPLIYRYYSCFFVDLVFKLWMDISGQIIMFHRPRFLWNKRISLPKRNLFGAQVVWGRYNLTRYIVQGVYITDRDGGGWASNLKKTSKHPPSKLHKRSSQKRFKGDLQVCQLNNLKVFLIRMVSLKLKLHHLKVWFFVIRIVSLTITNSISKVFCNKKLQVWW